MIEARIHFGRGTQTQYIDNFPIRKYKYLLLLNLLF